MPQAEPQPVRPSERILALDVIRGFAMFGVLLAYCLWNLGNVPEDSYSPLDLKLDAVASFLVDGKMYTILAFLFGLGFSIQLGRAESDSSAIRYYRRRLAALAAIGLAHALLLRNGDILLPYALIGFLLVPLRKSGDRTLFALAGLALLFPYLLLFLWKASGIALPERPDMGDAPYLVENAAWVRYWMQIAPLTWPNSLALFLLGFVAGRHRLLTRIAGERSKLLAIATAGLVATTLLHLLNLRLIPIGESEARRLAAGLSFTFHCWALSSAYVAAMLLALGTRWGVRLLTPLGAIGRMALTNYLLQAVVIVPLCIALDWFDRFTPTSAVALALAVFAFIQLPFSIFWLRHYQYGPAEWFWRLLTYGRAPPLKAAADYAPV